MAAESGPRGAARQTLRPSQVTIAKNKTRAVLALENEPEIAVQIALFITGFSALDVTLPSLFSQITGINPAASERILGTAKSVGARISMIDAACRSSDHGAEMNAFYDEVVQELKYIEKRRNLFAHAPMASTKKRGEIRALGFRMDQRTTREELLTESNIRKDCARVERTSYAIWSLLKGQNYELKPLRDVSRGITS